MNTIKNKQTKKRIKQITNKTNKIEIKNKIQNNKTNENKSTDSDKYKNKEYIINHKAPFVHRKVPSNFSPSKISH